MASGKNHPVIVTGAEYPTAFYYRIRLQENGRRLMRRICFYYYFIFVYRVGDKRCGLWNYIIKSVCVCVRENGI